MGHDTGLADRLRARGIPVIEVDGWTSRGSSSFSPAGSVNHHTAGPATGTAPSLGVVTHGRDDLAGPLCNVLQSREPDENDIAYVVAAGRANHAGSGGWNGLSGNSSVWGLEIEHTGTSPLSPARQDRAAQIHAAMFGGDPAYLCQHREWAPDRKIDAATEVDPDDFRNRYAAALAGRGPGGLDLTMGQYEDIMDALSDVMASLGSALVACQHCGAYYEVDGVFARWVPNADHAQGLDVGMRITHPALSNGQPYGVTADWLAGKLVVNGPHANVAGISKVPEG